VRIANGHIIEQEPRVKKIRSRRGIDDDSDQYRNNFRGMNNQSEAIQIIDDFQKHHVMKDFGKGTRGTVGAVGEPVRRN
jgi:hypothetical protein